MASLALRFRAFIASRLRHEIGPDEIGPDSVNWLVDPIGDRLVRRGGAAIIEDTFVTPTGLLESKWAAGSPIAGARPQQCMGIHSPSFTNDYSSPAVLFTNESAKLGTVAWIDPNNAGAAKAKQQLGKEVTAGTAGTENYTSKSNSPVYAKIPPLWFENGTTKMGRWISAAQREVPCSGSRGMIEHGNNLYIACQSTPLKWFEKRFNPDTTTHSQTLRLGPWLNYPPLHIGYGKMLASSGSGDNNWEDGDSFFFSVLFEAEDGSLSRPFVPRPKGASWSITDATNTVNAATIPIYAVTTAADVDLRSGHVLVGTIAGGNTYRAFRHTNLPIGPPGTRARWLLRSNKVKLTATTSITSIDALSLSVITRIDNNTTTEYENAAGDDSTLTASDRVRFDTIATPRSQYVAACDGRVVIGGNLKLSPAAIIIAPIGVAAAGDRNLADDAAALFGTTQVGVYVTSTILYLRIWTAIPGAPVTDMSFKLLTTTTLQNVVDAIIYSSGITAGHVRWGAQIVGGADPDTPLSNLAQTSSGIDFGDDGITNDATTGNMRCYANSYPGILYFSQTYLDTLPTDTQSIVMTSGSPEVTGGTASGWVRSDRRETWKRPPSAASGRLMGIAPLTGRAGVVCVCFYEKGPPYILRNIAQGGSGRDEDYRLVVAGGIDGCISHRTIVSGDGVVGAMGRNGYGFLDSEAAAIVSRDIQNTKRNRGEWTEEFVRAIAAASIGSADSHYLSASLIGEKLCVTYRTTAGGKRRVEYDFGEGSESTGLASVLKQSDSGRPRPYGWSAPITGQGLTVLGQYENATGIHHFGCEDSNAGSTGDGNIHEFDVGTTDNGTAIVSRAYSSTIPAPPRQAFSLKRLLLRYVKAATGLSVAIKCDGRTNQGQRSESFPLACDSTGANLYGELVSNIPQKAMAPKACIEFVIEDDGSGPSPEVNLLDVDYDLVDQLAVTP